MCMCVQTLRTLERQLEDDRAEVEEKERTKRLLMSRLEAVKAAQREMDGIVGQATEASEEYKKYKDVVREVRGKQNSIEVCNGDIAGVEAKKKHVATLMRKVEDKENAFRPECDLKVSASKQALADTRAELEDMRATLAKSREQREAARKRKADIAAEMQRLKDAHNAEMADMEEVRVSALWCACLPASSHDGVALVCAGFQGTAHVREQLPPPPAGSNH